MESYGGILYGANTPIPTASDSIYAHDVNVERSDMGGFSGVVTDLFDDLHSVSFDATATNPKVIKVWFKHSIQLYSVGFGCDETGKNFSNIKIKLFGSDEFVRETIDESADDTKYTSKAFDMEPAKANGIIVEFHTADEVTLSNLVVWKVTNVNARLSGVSTLTKKVEDISTFKGAINTHSADVHFVQVSRDFSKIDAVQTTVNTASSAGDVSHIVEDTTGFALGDHIWVEDGGKDEPQGVEITVIDAGAPGTLTYDRPMDNAYSTAAVVEVVGKDMSDLVGTLTSPVSYVVKPPVGETWHILRVLISIIDNVVADDGKFGGIGALPNGVVVRQNLSTGFKTISNWKTNADIKRDMYDVAYTDRAPAGEFGVNGKFLFKEIDFTPELIGDNGDFLEILIQDNLSELTSFTMSAQGHKTTE